MKKILSISSIFFISYFTEAQNIITNLSGYWPFSTSQLANDYSGNGNNGIINGATLATDRFGNCNQAYKFDGIDDIITVQTSTTVDMQNTDFTIALWIKTYMGDTNSVMVGKNLYGNWNGYLVSCNSSNGGYCTAYKHLTFYVAAGVQQDACTDNAVCADTSWHFITGVYDHNQNKTYLYVDAMQQSDIGQASGSTSNNIPLTFGGNYIGNYFYKGVLDDIRIYQRALSNTEILQLYNEPNPRSNNSNGNTIDTSFCTSSSISLNAGTASSYTWSTGVNTQTISVNNSGTYWVEIQPVNGCKQTDTFNLSIVSPPVINILKDTFVCSNSGYILNASYSGATSYHWSTGATSSSIITSASGVYWVDMYINQCVVRDSAQITLLNSPVINIPNDTVACSSPLTITINDTTLNYNWSTGNNSNQISINNSGTFWVQAQNQNGCKTTDTIHVAIVTPGAYQFLKDTSVCTNTSYILNASSANATSYNWSTGATSSSITPATTGIYWVDIHINQCVVRDSASITLVNPPVLNLKDTVICKDPIIINIPDTSLLINWWNGSHANQISITNVGTYSVFVSKNGCSTTDVFNVNNVEFTNSFIIPNIITPNDDGINDFFEFNTNGIIVKEFYLYNRWGKLIYSAENTVKWNGKQNNELVDDGTYYWTGVFINPCDNSLGDIKQKGFITILK